MQPEGCCHLLKECEHACMHESFKMEHLSVPPDLHLHFLDLAFSGHVIQLYQALLMAVVSRLLPLATVWATSYCQTNKELLPACWLTCLPWQLSWSVHSYLPLDLH